MNYIGLSTFDTANGPGVRVSLFCSGCTVHCKGCFNTESWDFKAGNPYTAEVEAKILKALESSFVSGLSLLGGDPLEDSNAPVLEALCRRVREKFGGTKSIWLWTGRRYEHVRDMPILKLVDVLVDGPFVEKLKTEEKGFWRGSTNQRLLKLKDGVAVDL